LGQPAFRAMLWSGLTLFCVGVALSGGRWWGRILWGVLAIMATVEVGRAVPIAPVKALLRCVERWKTR